MARGLNSGVIHSFAAFTAMVLLGAGGLGTAVVSAAGATKEEYELEAGSLVYDNAYTRVDLANSARVRQGYDGSYSLRTVDGTSYDLGTKTVAYEPQTSSLKVFGGGYFFREDGTVEKLSDCSSVSLDEAGFYKLSERKYLLVGDDIGDTDGLISTQG